MQGRVGSSVAQQACLTTLSSTSTRTPLTCQSRWTSYLPQARSQSCFCLLGEIVSEPWVALDAGTADDRST